MAMKLKVVGDRGELRDYFDLMTIEQRTGRTADEGLALFLERTPPCPSRKVAVRRRLGVRVPESCRAGR
jgi:hypothetical protein